MRPLGAPQGDGMRGRALWALLGVMGIVFALAACSRAGTGPGVGTAAVRFAIAADPSNLNPLFMHPDSASVEAQLARLSFEPFVDMDASGRLIPVLLAEIPTRANGGISHDGRTITYHLRHLRWSDGVPLTSADVLWTLHAILDPRNPVRSHVGYDRIVSATAPNATTVILHLKSAWAPAITSFFSYGTSPQVVLPAHILQSQAPLERAAFNADPNVVDGPYRLVFWHRGDALRYEANPLFASGRVRSAQLDVTIIPDPNTNFTLLTAGQLDWNLIAPSQRVSVEQHRWLSIDTVPTSVVAGLSMNVRSPILRDARIRRAIAMSIDRNAISQKITLGAYRVTNQVQPQFSWAYDANIMQPGFHPHKADQAFDAAGYRRGRDGMRRDASGKILHLAYVSFPESSTGVRIATFVQAALAARGVSVTVKSVSNAQLFLPVDGVLASGHYDLAYVVWTMGADPDDSAIYRCGASENFMHWCNPKIGTLEDRALNDTEQSSRRADYAKIATIVAHDVPVLWLFNAQYLYAHRSDLHGFAPNAFLPTWNANAWYKTRPSQ